MLGIIAKNANPLPELKNPLKPKLNALPLMNGSTKHKQVLVVGKFVGLSLKELVGESLGKLVGETVGLSLGEVVGDGVCEFRCFSGIFG